MEASQYVSRSLRLIMSLSIGIENPEQPPSVRKKKSPTHHSKSEGLPNNSAAEPMRGFISLPDARGRLARKSAADAGGDGWARDTAGFHASGGLTESAFVGDVFWAEERRLQGRRWLL